MALPTQEVTSEDLEGFLNALSSQLSKPVPPADVPTFVALLQTLPENFWAQFPPPAKGTGRRWDTISKKARVARVAVESISMIVSRVDGVLETAQDFTLILLQHLFALISLVDLWTDLQPPDQFPQDESPHILKSQALDLARLILTTLSEAILNSSNGASYGGWRAVRRTSQHCLIAIQGAISHPEMDFG